MKSQIELEIEQLDQDLQEGRISMKEYTIAIRNMERDERAAIEEEAQRAYDNVMGRY